VDLVEQVSRSGHPGSDLAPGCFLWSYRSTLHPHPFPASLVLEMDGQIAGFQALCNEAA